MEQHDFHPPSPSYDIGPPASPIVTDEDHLQTLPAFPSSAARWSFDPNSLTLDTSNFDRHLSVARSPAFSFLSDMPLTDGPGASPRSPLDDMPQTARDWRSPDPLKAEFSPGSKGANEISEWEKRRENDEGRLGAHADTRKRGSVVRERRPPALELEQSVDIAGRLLPQTPPALDPRLAFASPPSPVTSLSSSKMFRGIGGRTRKSSALSTSSSPTTAAPLLQQSYKTDAFYPPTLPFAASTSPASPRRQSSSYEYSHQHSRRSSSYGTSSCPAPAYASSSHPTPSLPGYTSGDDYFPPQPPPASHLARAKSSDELSHHSGVSDESDIDATFASTGPARKVARHLSPARPAPELARPSLISLAELRKRGSLLGPSPEPTQRPQPARLSTTGYSSSPPRDADPASPYYSPSPHSSPEVPRKSFPFPTSDLPPPPPLSISIPPKNRPSNAASILLTPLTDSSEIVPVRFDSPGSRNHSGADSQVRRRFFGTAWFNQEIASPGSTSGSFGREQSIPLESLAQRAAAVERKLERGGGSSFAASPAGTPRRESMTSRLSFGYLRSGSNRERTSWSRVAEDEGVPEDNRRSRKLDRRRTLIAQSRRKTQDWLAATTEEPLMAAEDKPSWWYRQTHPRGKPIYSSRKFRAVMVTLAALLILAVVIGVAVSRTHSSSTVTTSDHLRATCVNPSGSSPAVPIAQGLLDVANRANSLFDPSLNLTRLAFVVNNYLGHHVSSSSHDCSSQLALVTFSSLPASTFPNRLAWTEAAALWTAGLSETNTTVQHFVTSHDFSAFGDGPSSQPNTNFQLLVAGFILDFSTMNITVPTLTWTSAVNPSNDQASLVVGTRTELVLNRLTSNAVAASNQRKTALEHYWSELNLSSVDLDLFRDAVQKAPIIFPFDASANVGGSGVMELANTAASNTSFPLSIGCLPGLSSSEISAANSVEVNGFGLTALSSSSPTFGDACLVRPLYGVLNILNLRLPFPDTDTRSLLPKQGAVADVTNNVRLTLHAGELLAGLQAGAPTSPSSPSSPHSFGIFSSMDHVLLNWLQLVSPATAQDLVTYVLAATDAPPLSTSPLFESTGNLTSYPLLEVQLWGGLFYDDLDGAISSIASTDNSTLFLASSTGNAFRNWALASTSNEIKWAISSEIPEVASDDSLTNSSAFTVFWDSTKSSAKVQVVWDDLVEQGLAK